MARNSGTKWKQCACFRILHGCGKVLCQINHSIPWPCIRCVSERDRSPYFFPLPSIWRVGIGQWSARMLSYEAFKWSAVVLLRGASDGHEAHDKSPDDTKTQFRRRMPFGLIQLSQWLTMLNSPSSPPWSLSENNCKLLNLRVKSHRIWSFWLAVLAEKYFLGLSSFIWAYTGLQEALFSLYTLFVYDYFLTLPDEVGSCIIHQHISYDDNIYSDWTYMEEEILLGHCPILHCGLLSSMLRHSNLLSWMKKNRYYGFVIFTLNMLCEWHHSCPSRCTDASSPLSCCRHSIWSKGRRSHTTEEFELICINSCLYLRYRANMLYSSRSLYQGVAILPQLCPSRVVLFWHSSRTPYWHCGAFRQPDHCSLPTDTNPTELEYTRYTGRTRLWPLSSLSFSQQIWVLLCGFMEAPELIVSLNYKIKISFWVLLYSICRSRTSRK